MAGLLSAASAFSWRRALQISVNAFAAVTLLWGVQKVLVPHAGFFLERLQNEQQFTARPTPERVGEVARAFFVRSMVAPTPTVTGRDYPLVPAPSAGEESALATDAAGPPAMAHGRGLSMQRAPGQGTPWGWLATAAWLALLGIGVWSMRDLPALGRFRAVVVLFLAGQLGLHLIYGKETFLYALDYFPALLLLAAFALLGPRRRVARICAALTLLGASVDNVRQLRGAAAFVATEAATVGVAPQSAPPNRPEEPGAPRR
jgi:hypothetical protein